MMQSIYDFILHRQLPRLIDKSILVLSGDLCSVVSTFGASPINSLDLTSPVMNRVARIEFVILHFVGILWIVAALLFILKLL